MSKRCIIPSADMNFRVRYTLSLKKSFRYLEERGENVDSYITESLFPKHHWEKGFSDFSSIAYFLSDELSYEGIVWQMYLDQCRAATLRELIAFAMVNFDNQIKHPVVALGSTGKSKSGHDFFPYYVAPKAKKDKLDLSLGLTHISSRPREECFFLAVYS